MRFMLRTYTQCIAHLLDFYRASNENQESVYRTPRACVVGGQSAVKKMRPWRQLMRECVVGGQQRVKKNASLAANDEGVSGCQPATR